MVSHVNSEGERVEIAYARGKFEGMPLLVIHDDPPPRGSGIKAPMLLDKGTRSWLLEKLIELDEREDDHE